MFWNRSQVRDALKGTQPLEVSCFQTVDCSHPFLGRSLEELKQEGRVYLRNPATHPTYASFSLYWQQGSRKLYEQDYFEKRRRLLCFSLLCWLAPEEGEYLEALQEIVWSICSEPYWSVPAHFLDGEEEPLPLEEYPTHLDLFACETGFALAEMLRLHRGKLGSLLEAQVRLELNRRIFEPFLDPGRWFRFEGMANNWSAVCGAAVGGAALTLLEAGPRLTSLVHRSLSCMQVYLDSFGNDGICVEGAGYWTYGFGFFTCFASLLSERSGGGLDLLSCEKVKAIAQSLQFYFLQGNTTLSFSDGVPTDRFRAGLGSYLQKQWPDTSLPAFEHAAGIMQDHCGRFCLSLRDFLWFDPSARFGLPAERCRWLSDAQWFLSCRRTFCLAAKGGHNGESHNHNDCGSFMLLKNGETIFADLGAGLYTKEYFGPARYENFNCSSRSHNIPIVDGQEQGAGTGFAATNVIAGFGEEEDRFSLSLESCYPPCRMETFQRSIRHLHRDGLVVLEDRFTMLEPATVRETFLSHHPIKLGEGYAVICPGERQAILKFDPLVLKASTAEQQYHGHDGNVCKAYLLYLETKAAGLSFHIALAIE